MIASSWWLRNVDEPFDAHHVSWMLFHFFPLLDSVCYFLSTNLDLSISFHFTVGVSLTVLSFFLFLTDFMQSQRFSHHTLRWLQLGLHFSSKKSISLVWYGLASSSLLHRICALLDQYCFRVQLRWDQVSASAATRWTFDVVTRNHRIRPVNFCHLLGLHKFLAIGYRAGPPQVFFFFFLHLHTPSWPTIICRVPHPPRVKFWLPRVPFVLLDLLILVFD